MMWAIKHKSGRVLFVTSDEFIAENRRKMGWKVEEVKMAERTYTEKLERVINIGVDLRHSTRVKSENQQSIIKAQAVRINDLESQLAVAKKEKKKKKAAKIDYKSRFEKLHERYERQEEYLQKLKDYIKGHNDGAMPDELTNKVNP